MEYRRRILRSYKKQSSIGEMKSDKNDGWRFSNFLTQSEPARLSFLAGGSTQLELEHFQMTSINLIESQEVRSPRLISNFQTKIWIISDWWNFHQKFVFWQIFYSKSFFLSKWRWTFQAFRLQIRFWQNSHLPVWSCEIWREIEKSGLFVRDSIFLSLLLYEYFSILPEEK